jgi:hypothetical protein
VFEYDILFVLNGPFGLVHKFVKGYHDCPMLMIYSLQLCFIVLSIPCSMGVTMGTIFGSS